MRLAVVVLICVLASAPAVVSLALSPQAGARPTQVLPTRVIDRTLSCRVEARAGVREVHVVAQSGTRLREDRTKWRYLASANVRDSQETFVWVAAGNPQADLAPGVPARDERLGLEPGEPCRPGRPIPLARAGLSGHRAGPLADTYECTPGRRVTVRVRAEFRAPTTLRLRRYVYGETQLAAVGTVVRAEVAVRSADGAPLAYLRIAESGAAAIHVATSCIPD